MFPIGNVLFKLLLKASLATIRAAVLAIFYQKVMMAMAMGTYRVATRFGRQRICWC